MNILKVLKMAAVSALILGATSATAAISGSKHDLTATGGAANTINADTEEQLCVFCHTPHAASSDFANAPLWNKATMSSTFTMYGATIATTTTDAAPNDPSKACLSCHDGASAINSVVNAPGSGMGTGYVSINGSGDAAAFVMPAGVTNIGTDLGNDHPISIVYETDGRASLKPTATALLGTWSGGTDIASVLRGGKVECSTCHDPHLGENPTFLRNTNVGSQLCISCHDK